MISGGSKELPVSSFPREKQMDLLNLDDLVRITKKVQLAGEVYEVAEQTVGGMLEAIRLARAADQKDVEPEVILEQLITTAQKLLPKCPVEILHGLKVEQLSALIEFASAPAAETVARAEPSEDAPAEAGKQ